jgi:hypothetical protein
MTVTRQDLLNALSQIQDHLAHSHHDILTITGCGMTDDQVRAHLEFCFRQIATYSETFKPSRKRKAA